MKKDESFLNVVPMPHTVGEAFREALSEIPEKTDQELYFPEEESQNETEIPKTDDEEGNENDKPGDNKEDDKPEDDKPGD